MKTLHIKRWHKITLAIVLFVFLLLFTAPRIARKYVVNNSYELIGRKLDIDKIRLNYLTGVLRVKKMVFYEKDSLSSFISFNTLLINIDYWPFVRKELKISRLWLDGLYVQVLQDKDTFNFSDLLPAEDTLSSEINEVDTTAKTPLNLTVNDIRLSDGLIKYTDIPLEHTISLDSINLMIPGFSWSSSSAELATDLQFVSGGGLHSALEINQSDSTYKIEMKLDSLNLDVIQPYLEENIYISDLKGYYSNDLLIRGNMQHLMQISLTGGHRIDDFVLTDTSDIPVFAFQHLNIEIDTLIMDQYLIDLQSITLHEPSLHFELVDTTNNLLAMMRSSGEEVHDPIHTDTVREGEQKAFSVSLEALKIDGGEIVISDKTLSYPFLYNVNELNIQSNNISESTALSVHLTALLNQAGRLNTTLILDGSNLSIMNLALAIKQFRMKDMEPYFKHYFGYSVSQGLMNFTTKNEFQQGGIVSNSNLYLRNFTLGEADKSNAVMKIPLRLALGILTNRDGVIDLDIPVVVKDDKTEIKNIGKIIFKALGNVFLKAATSPYNLLADLYKINPDKLKQVHLGMFETETDESGLESFDLIARILNDKPGLRIDFYHSLDKDLAMDSLAASIARNDFILWSESQDTNEGNSHDSLFADYMLKNTVSDHERMDSSITDLCIAYVGKETLHAKLDSIRADQINFANNYLSIHKEVDTGRYKIHTQPPDTVIPPIDMAAFLIYFTPNSIDSEE